MYIILEINFMDSTIPTRFTIPNLYEYVKHDLLWTLEHVIC